MNQTDESATKFEGQLKEDCRIGWPMDHDAGAGLLNPYAQTKVGKRYHFCMVGAISERKSGADDAVNGTIGALLEDDGNLAINAVVDEAIRASTTCGNRSLCTTHWASGVSRFGQDLALGERRNELEAMGISMTATASAGGSGALYLAATNFANRGDHVLLRDRHWGPYKGFFSGCDLKARTYPLLPKRLTIPLRRH